MNFKTLLAVMSIVFINIVGCERESSSQTLELPTGWFKSGSNPQNYEMSVDKQIKHGGNASVYIKFIGDDTEGFGALIQIFKADAYRDKRVRLTAWMKTEDADSAQLWMRLDGTKQMLGFDNMDNRPVVGTTEWQKYAITLDVPEPTINIAYGALLGKNGKVWIDDFQFEVVGQEVDPTNMLSQEEMNKELDRTVRTDYASQPANLDFEN